MQVSQTSLVRRLAALLAAAAMLSGCAVTIPTDPNGTLDRVRGELLRVGVSPNSPWTTPPEGQEDEPGGIEARLVSDFAASLGAEVAWTFSGEEDLMGGLERGELDLVVGGLTARSPWTSHASLTYPYATTVGLTGEKQLHVMAVPPGENAFLVELEHFLLDAEVDAESEAAADPIPGAEVA